MMVSVVIPNYNHAPYLEQRLNSVLNQTFEDLEVIILDDCSTDSSKEIIEKYRQHPKVSTVIFNEVNSGSTFRQWQKGINAARGEWVWIAESDDACDENFLSVLLDNNIPDQCGLRYVESVEMDAQGAIGPVKPHPVKEGVTNGLEFFTKNLMLVNRIPNASAVITRRDLLENFITPEIESFKFVGDWLVWCKLCFKTSVFYSTKTRNYHRQHTDNVRSRVQENGVYFQEFSAFRMLVEKEVDALEISGLEKGLILKENRSLRYYETGMRGIELIRKRHFGQALPLILKASIRPKLNLYFIRSCFYWMFKAN